MSQKRTHYPAHWTPIQIAAYQVVHEYRRGDKRGAEALAPALGKAPHTICNEVNPDYQGAKLGLDDAVAMEIAARDYRILEAHAAAGGHVCIPLPDPAQFVGDAALLELFADWQAAMGRTCESIKAALDPHGPGGSAITRAEAQAIHNAGHRHMTRFMEFLERVQSLAEED